MDDKIDDKKNSQKNTQDEIQLTSDDAAKESNTPRHHDTHVIDAILADDSPNISESFEDFEKEVIEIIHEKMDDNIEDMLEESTSVVKDNQYYDNLEGKITKLIASGHMFKAHEIAQREFEQAPENVVLTQMYSAVLLKTGAVRESLTLIYKLLSIDLPEKLDEKISIDLAKIKYNDFVKTGRTDVIANIGNILKDAWNFTRNCQHLEIARELYLASFARDAKTSTGINAAWLSWLTGEDEHAKKLASEVLRLLPPIGLEAEFYELINLSESQLLLGREEDACRLYAEAMQNPPEDYTLIVRARLQLTFLKEAGFKVPSKAFDILVPPTIAVFTGHAIDHPSFEVSLFPPELEQEVYNIIAKELDAIDAKIGYSSASCGSDLLFIEALLARGGEINLILPYLITDFLETNIRHAGPRWEKRFEKALAAAHTISFAVEDKYLGHDMLHRFANHVMQGTAIMRGKFLTSEPHLIAVWHSRAESLPGGPADFVDRWTNISTLHMIDLDETDEIANKETAPSTKKSNHSILEFDPFIPQSPERVIRTMMFSDLSGYSKLQDEHVPAFLDFLTRLQSAIAKIDLSLEAVNTWGDAIFAVSDSAITIADFGLKYCDIVETLGKKYSEFPFPIRARISLHAGPVFVAEDPFIHKINYYGGHINRAARLEPVTTVGQVYATQQFVALLHGETSGESHECEQQGIKYYERYSTEYVGIISLAKSFGQQEVYHLRWR